MIQTDFKLLQHINYLLLILKNDIIVNYIKKPNKKSILMTSST